MIFKIFYAINMCFYIYSLMIFARCLLTWLPVDWNQPIFKALKDSTDIYLNLFKKFVPPIGMIDVSPMVAIFALIIMQRIIVFLFGLIVNLFGLG